MVVLVSRIEPAWFWPASSAGGQVLQRIDALEAANRALTARLTQTEQILAHGPSVAGGTGDGAVPLPEAIRLDRLALAVLQLRIASQTHLPFVSELALVRQLARNEAGLGATLDTLAPHAATGVATVAELRDSFGVILLPRLQALLDGKIVSSQTWIGWAFDWMFGWVFTPPAGDYPHQRQRIAAATDRLTADDLAGAVAQLAQLNEPSSTLVARWLKEAHARLAVDAAYDNLSGIAATLFGTPRSVM